MCDTAYRVKLHCATQRRVGLCNVGHSVELNSTVQHSGESDSAMWDTALSQTPLCNTAESQTLQCGTQRWVKLRDCDTAESQNHSWKSCEIIKRSQQFYDKEHNIQFTVMPASYFNYVSNLCIYAYNSIHHHSFSALKSRYWPVKPQ